MRSYDLGLLQRDMNLQTALFHCISTQGQWGYSMKKYILAILSVLGLVALDQWTKYLAVVKLAGKTAYVLIDGVFELTYTENRGAAFGLFQNQRWIFLILTSIVLLAMIYCFIKIPSKRRFFPLQLLCVFIIAGALGNMIDRILNGYVVDFLYFSLIDFPVFNVADCYVTWSAVLAIILLCFYYQEDELKGILK